MFKKIAKYLLISIPNKHSFYYTLYKLQPLQNVDNLEPSKSRLNLSRVKKKKKPVFGVYEHVRPKPECTVTSLAYDLILNLLDHNTNYHQISRVKLGC